MSPAGWDCAEGGHVPTNYRGVWVCECCSEPCEAPPEPQADPFHLMCVLRERYLDAVRAQSPAGKLLEVLNKLVEEV